MLCSQLQAARAAAPEGDLLEGIDLLSLSEGEMARMRWNEIAIIFQGAMNALNPVMRVEAQIKDALTVHMGRMSRQASDGIVAEALNMVNLPVDVARSMKLTWLSRVSHEVENGTFICPTRRCRASDRRRASYSFSGVS